MEFENTEKRAGFLIRLWANILDAIIISVPLTIIDYLITGTQDGHIATLLDTLYGIFLPVLWAGYTVGKRIAGVRIVKINGENVGIGTMLMRNLLGGLFYVVTLGIGAIISAFMVGMRQDKRAIHDLIAGTCVVYAQK